MQIVEAIGKLSVEEKAVIWEELQDNKGVFEYLAYKELPTEAMEELKRRDEAFTEGRSKILTWGEVQAKLSF